VDKIPATTKNLTVPLSHQHCIFCGPQNVFGFKIQFRALGLTGVSAQIIPRNQFQGYTGILHGGIIASLLDCAMCHALFNQGIEGLTAKMEIRFLHSIPLNQPFVLNAQYINQRTSAYYAEATIEQGSLTYARAKGVFFESKTK
jgi:acyl-coenzyme A thioesterase PaaI-like protein